MHPLSNSGMGGIASFNRFYPITKYPNPIRDPSNIFIVTEEAHYELHALFGSTARMVWGEDPAFINLFEFMNNADRLELGEVLRYLLEKGETTNLSEVFTRLGESVDGF